MSSPSLPHFFFHFWKPPSISDLNIVNALALGSHRWLDYSPSTLALALGQGKPDRAVNGKSIDSGTVESGNSAIVHCQMKVCAETKTRTKTGKDSIARSLSSDKWHFKVQEKVWPDGESENR